MTVEGGREVVMPPEGHDNLGDEGGKAVANLNSRQIAKRQ
jgi:hypothetical protein